LTSVFRWYINIPVEYQQVNGKVRLSDEAYEKVKRMIVRGELAPGRLLSERELMAYLEVGRTPLRQALQRLEQEHLLTVVPGGGYLVAGITFDGVVHILELRRPVEALSARLAATWALPKDIDELNSFIYYANRPSEREDGYWHLAIDGQFHDLVAAASRNPYVRTTVNHLFSLTQRVMISVHLEIPRVEDEIVFYKALTKAITEHDPDTAETLMLGHVAMLNSDFTNGISLA
jgi:DNA-binding GntR family transcriptional regulator